ASVSQSLEGAELPIPTVTWRSGALRLSVTVFAIGEPEASSLVARYRVANTGAQPVTPTLYLALRPFQVDPPAQFLNLRGGCAPLREVTLEPLAARVDGDTALVCLTPPAAAGASTFAGGDIVADHLRAGLLPAAQSVRDDADAASAAYAWPLALLPGEEAETALVIPLHPASLAALAGNLPPPGDTAATRAWVADALRRCGNAWRAKVTAVRITLPPSAAPLAANLRAQLGWILVTRAGPALQPGARSYARSWIRDGALTASALQRLGLPGPAREFAEWYAPYQYPSGKIPCVVDARGADPVPEHDSSGEFIFMVAEDYRYTADRDFAARMWPRVRAAAAWLDSLRHERLGAAWRAPERAEFHGLLPPSISHEGYSARPMHSYWDDFFALRGFRDAAFLAGALGSGAEQARWDAVATEFACDLAASVTAAMRRHDVDYVPGCADLGDFDATSTAIAFDPTGAAALLPPEAVRATFERYWQFFQERRAGSSWDACTPYEMRIIGAFVRLGWRERASELLDWFLAGQRPVGWRQWPEVVTRERRVPRFLGDLPHTWVGADFLRSAADLFAYGDETAQALVIGAGIPRAWIDEAPGVSVDGLRTPYGPLSFTMRREDQRIVVRVGDGLTVPPGGIVVKGPWEGRAGAMTLNGRSIRPRADGAVLLRAVPARLEIEVPGP
ncbi:MAG: glucosidase family protein, partial [Candidatus Krumholzibacteriia bacterium]